MKLFKSKAVQRDRENRSHSSDAQNVVEIVNVDSTLAAAFRSYHSDPGIREQFKAGERRADRGACVDLDSE